MGRMGLCIWVLDTEAMGVQHDHIVHAIAGIKADANIITDHGSIHALANLYVNQRQDSCVVAGQNHL